MQEYWDMISMEHCRKLKALVINRGIELDTALRSIVNHLKRYPDPKVPGYFRDTVAANEIEEMIDLITG